MSMRVRDLQQYLGKFTEDKKGTAISNCHIYIETESGSLEEIRRIEIQESNIIRLQTHPTCLLYTSPSPRDRTRSRMPSSA